MNTNGSTYYNDNNSFCCEVLRKNINAGHLPEGYVDERDIREVHASDFMGYNHVHLFAGIGAFAYAFNQARVPNSIRLLTIGFPCKNISNAGDKTGLAGHQSGLCPEAARLLRELLDCGIRPQYIIVENVERLLQRGMASLIGSSLWCRPHSGKGAPYCLPHVRGIGRAEAIKFRFHPS
jgi:site-specific DNA-cytosine methylase